MQSTYWDGPDFSDINPSAVDDWTLCSGTMSRNVGTDHIVANMPFLGGTGSSYFAETTLSSTSMRSMSARPPMTVAPVEELLSHRQPLFDSSAGPVPHIPRRQYQPTSSSVLQAFLVENQVANSSSTEDVTGTILYRERGVISQTFGADVISYFAQILGVDDPGKFIYPARSHNTSFVLFTAYVFDDSKPKACILDSAHIPTTDSDVVTEVIRQTRWVPYSGTQRKHKCSLEAPIFFFLEDGAIGISLREATKKGDINIRAAKNRCPLEGKKTTKVHINLQSQPPWSSQIRIPQTVEALLRSLGQTVNRFINEREIAIPREMLIIIGLVHVGEGSRQLILGLRNGARPKLCDGSTATNARRG